jgi:GDP-L-fucose synthase
VNELVSLITKNYGYEPDIKYDLSKPTMIPTRLLDGSRAKAELGWQSKISLQDGIKKTIDWYNNNKHMYA